MLEDGSVHLHTSFSSSHGQHKRNTLHFALNHKVRPHFQGSWEEQSYVVIAPLEAVIEKNGIPTALCAVDTWWTREKNEPIVMPHAKMILPDERLQTLIERSDGNITYYKSRNFSYADLERIFDQEGFLFPESEVYKSILKCDLNTILERSQISWDALKQFDRGDDVFSGLNPEDKASAEGLVASYLCRAASAQVISDMGCVPHAGGDYTWEDLPGAAHAFTHLAQELGCSQGAKPHYYTAYSKLEAYWESNEPIPTHIFEELDEKTKNCIKYHENQILKASPLEGFLVLD